MRVWLIFLASFSLWGCRLAGETPKERNEEINRGLLERLSTEALTPVEDFDQESYFEQLERLYAASPINAWFAPTLRVGEGEAEVRLPLRPDFHHAAGAVHGARELLGLLQEVRRGHRRGRRPAAPARARPA